MNQIRQWNEYVNKHWEKHYDPDTPMTFSENTNGYFRITLFGSMTFEEFYAAYLDAENVFRIFKVSFYNGQASLELAFYGNQIGDSFLNIITPPELLT